MNEDVPHPRLNRADAWLLAALTEGSHDGRPVTLREFIHDADWLNRTIPTFDEVSFGIPRLAAAGLITVGEDVTSGMVFRSTPRARALRASVRATSLGDVLSGVGRAIGALPYPEPEPPENRSLGRQPGLDREDLESAIHEHGEWVDRLSRPLVDVAQALRRSQKPRT